MSLVPDYEDSSESSEEDVISPTESIQSNSPKPEKLPTPGFISSETDTRFPTTSVFTNPFIQAEIAKKAILEKHVKMVNTNDNSPIINGKKICWNYRKGRCRFGHNCKYAHDSDLQKTKEQLDSENQIHQSIICQKQEVPQPSANELNQIKEDSVGNQRRKRPGLTQGLIPGKKVMKNYMTQRNAQN